MDEPFAALDEITRFRLNNDLLELWQDERFTVVFVTHSVFESVFLSNRIVVMAARPGRVFREIAVDAPYPRDEAFRTSADYAALCRQASDVLGERHHAAAEACMTAIERHGGAVRARPRGGAPRARRSGWSASAMGAAARHHDRWRSGCGTASASGTRSRPTSCRARAWCCRRCSTTAALLFGSLLVTLRITFLGLLLAVVGGVGLAVLFAQSKWVEMSFFPFAVILQVTPIVAIVPLIIIYVDNQTAKLLLCAWIVAFFPILSNTTLGLNSVDRNLRRPVPALRRDALAAAAGICACRPRCPISSAA